MITEVNARNFVLQNIDIASLNLSKARYFFLLVKAQWCPHCTRYIKQFEEFSTQFPNAHFLVLEADTKENDNMIRKWSGLVYPQVPTPAGCMDHSKGKAFFNPEKRLMYPTVVLYSSDGTPIMVVENRNDLASTLAKAEAAGFSS